MYRFIACVVAVMLAGCASTGSWRELQIDGSSVESFDDSVTLFLEELPYTRRELFSLALTDIWYTGLRDAAQNDDSYAEEQFAAQLNGLGYEEIVAIADAEEPRVSEYYYSTRNRDAGAARGRGAVGWGGGFGQPGSNGIVVFPGTRGVNGGLPRPGGAN